MCNDACDMQHRSYRVYWNKSVPNMRGGDTAKSRHGTFGIKVSQNDEFAH